jgi:hypothetical protein
MVPRHARAALVAWAFLMMPALAGAQDQGASGTAGDRSFTLRTSLKASALVSHAPDDPVLFPERDSATSFWRLRLEPAVHLGEGITVAAAYEQRLRVFSGSPGLAGLGVLPAETPAPYRVRQLDWQIAGSPRASWRHEIDRAYLGLHLGGANVTVGRQAVGWGRGVLFGAVDLFSPFSPLEADREWRRGVDAIRADIKLADRVSFDAVGAFGESLDASVFAGRLRGYAGKADVELVAGRRARDLFSGVTSSAAVGDVEVHGELAVFRAPDALPAGGLGEDGRVVLKAVAGGSYRFPLGHGVLVYVEYHYSGFGAKHAADVLPLLADAAFRDRYLRGDTQILGRHALAALASYEFSPELAVSGLWLQSPVDGSGVAAPSATVTFSDRLSLVATAYVPYGRPPHGLVLNSEYGAGALSGFLQVRMYR